MSRKSSGGIRGSRAILASAIAAVSCGAAVEAIALELARTGQTIPYGTGDDGDLEVGVEWPSPRFVANGDGTLTDALTGLVWLLDANCADTLSFDPNGTGDGSMSWDDAFVFVSGINTGTIDPTACGYTGSATDWRFPNIVEMESLVNAGVVDQTTWLIGQGFSQVQASHWTSTTWVEENILRAFVLFMTDGRIDNAFKSGGRHHVMLVRSGADGVEDPGIPANLWRPGSSPTSGHGVQWPIGRLVDQGDGTVKDDLTGLMWLKDASCLGTGRWSEGLATVADFNLTTPSGTYACADYTQGTYDDWRLPNRKEMFSLLDINESRPALPAGNPFVNVPSFGLYLTSTSATVPTDEFWLVETWIFSGVEAEPKNSTASRVWAVRTPASPPVPGLSTWGLVAVALGLGLAGLRAATGWGMRRRHS